MSAVRIAVKWCFKEVTQQFGGIDYKKMQKALLSSIGLSYCVAVLFHNAHVCLHRPQISQFFLDHAEELDSIRNNINLNINELDIELTDPPQLHEYFHS